MGPLNEFGKMTVINLESLTCSCQVRFVPDKKGRPCDTTLVSCNSLSDSDSIFGKFTDGKHLASFEGEDVKYNFIGDIAESFCGLHFDLPSTELFEHGQILIVLEEGTSSIFKH